MSRRSGIGGAIVALLLVISAGPAAAIESEAERALVIEAASGSVLFSRNADQSFEAGNFTKLMTAATVFTALEAGDLDPEQPFRVSEHAWRTGGAPAGTTTMFAEVNSDVRAGDLVSGLVIQYANDAAIALAEGLAGGEEPFAERMNALSSEFGLQASHFADPTGLAAAASTTTLQDLATLVEAMRTRFPDRMSLYAASAFEWNGIDQLNKSTFLRSLAGTEGYILAYTPEAGFGAAASAVRDGRRVLVLVSGLESARARDTELRRLLDAAYSEFATVAVAGAGEVVGEVRVFGGTRGLVGVAGAAPILATLPTADRSAVSGEIVYDGPVPAPIAPGDPVARLVLSANGVVVQNVPLVAAEAVAAGDIRQRASDALYELVLGWW